MGYWFGWGYCFLTDVHWDIKRALGEENLPASFVSYIFHDYVDWYPPASFVNQLVGGGFAVIFVIVMIQLAWQWWRRIKARTPAPGKLN